MYVLVKASCVTVLMFLIESETSHESNETGLKVLPGVEILSAIPGALYTPKFGGLDLQLSPNRLFGDVGMNNRSKVP